MICNVCKQNHNEPLKKWCDRSDSEIEIDRLEAENARFREALIELSYSKVIKNDPESREIITEALNKDNEDQEPDAVYDYDGL